MNTDDEPTNVVYSAEPEEEHPSAGNPARAPKR
jgi:hypothetical protein